MSNATAAAPLPHSSVSHNDLANAIRALAMDAVEAAKSGHPGMPMGMADVATVLFQKFLKFDPKNPTWPDRDRFVLSAGHGSMLQYALLYLTGYEKMSLDEIKRFRQLHALTAGHPEVMHDAGIETTTGPLGQGIATAVGMALAERILNARFGDDVNNHYTYVIASDGDMMEGISHEACSLAGHLGLHKLIVLYDDNNISIDGPTSLSFTDNTAMRFEAYGWQVSSVDGHDAAAIENAIRAAQSATKPVLICCKTIIGYGAPTKANKASSHGSPLGKDEIAGARAALGWPHEPFHIPADILAEWRASGARGAADFAAWQKRLNAAPAAVRTDFNNALAGTMPAAALQALKTFKQKIIADKPSVATRAASGHVLDVLVPAWPELVGGSADLTGSNNTFVKAAGAIINHDNYNGRYIHYGVREHGMCAMMNGMALHGGVVPYSGTFLSFADYCRPAIRLAALMKQRVVFVMTHDSIGLGEDGPTHQPVEHLASLRAIPNLLVFRPCDTIEAAECWELALASTTRPSVMALTRQNLITARSDAGDNKSAWGGYVLRDAVKGKAIVTIMATGSEVEIALAAQDLLAADNIMAKVVSIPSFELFAMQDDDYRADVLGRDTLRVAIEAGIRMGWDTYLGPNGIFIGMSTFGESAPAPELYRHFGITAENTAQRVHAALAA